jgi:hypothetical protein
MRWQKASGYGRRSLVETAIGGYRHLIGPKLHARTRPSQKSEVAIAVGVLNTMIQVRAPSLTSVSPASPEIEHLIRPGS